MAEQLRENVAAYFRQQCELGMPDLVLDTRLVAGLGRSAPHASSSRQPAGGNDAMPHSGDSYEDRRRALVQLYRAVENCHNCGLGDLRNKFVFGSGNAGAKLLIIGEAPGEDEDRQGLPFVGAAGALLTKMLAAIELDRKEDVFITNILKCRPPGNRNPETSEARACSSILKRQIDIISPKVILLLGRIAAHELLARSESLAKLRGEKLDYRGIPVLVTYHPAALLRNASYKAPAWEDLQRLQKLLKEM